MAQVDFSNAKLDVNTANDYKPLTTTDYLGFDSYSYLSDPSGSQISMNDNKRILSKTNSKATILFEGQFTASGTEFYIYFTWWKVSNISFSAGDTYSFAIDIEAKGNV